MSIRTTATAFTTAFALAVVLTTVSTPAFAEKSKDGQTKTPPPVEVTDKRTKVEQAKPGSVVNAVNTGPKYEKDDGGSIIDVINANPQPNFKPDVRVVYLNNAWNGSSRLYRFRVENIGIETAKDIGLSSTVRKVSSGGAENAAQIEHGHYVPIGSLATGQSQELVITCTPQPNWNCTSASLNAQVDHDLNPANNSAGSN